MQRPGTLAKDKSSQFMTTVGGRQGFFNAMLCCTLLNRCKPFMRDLRNEEALAGQPRAHSLFERFVALFWNDQELQSQISRVCL